MHLELGDLQRCGASHHLIVYTHSLFTMYIDIIMCVVHRLQNYYADCRSIILSTGKSLKDDPIPIDHANEDCDCDENGVEQKIGSK